MYGHSIQKLNVNLRLTEHSMTLDEKTGVEYMLLRNYEENGLIGRGFLLRMPFVVLR
jgi:hypothetical protein